MLKAKRDKPEKIVEEKNSANVGLLKLLKIYLWFENCVIVLLKTMFQTKKLLAALVWSRTFLHNYKRNLSEKKFFELYFFQNFDKEDKTSSDKKF